MIKRRTNPKPTQGPANTDRLDRALSRLEAAAGLQQEGLEMARAIGRDLRLILARKQEFLNAVRALQTIAASRCEVGHPDGQPCPAHGDDRGEWCWPCYARHVGAGGTP